MAPQILVAVFVMERREPRIRYMARTRRSAVLRAGCNTPGTLGSYRRDSEPRSTHESRPAPPRAGQPPARVAWAPGFGPINQASPPGHRWYQYVQDRDCAGLLAEVRNATRSTRRGSWPTVNRRPASSAPARVRERAMSDDRARTDAIDAEPVEDLPGDGAGVHGQVIHLITTVGPPLTIATALLFYFGWVRTSVEAETLGVSDTVFGYSAQDYIMRSISALFLPVVAAAGLGIVAVLVHGWLVTDLHTPPSRRRRRVARCLAAACLPAFAVLPVVSGLAEAYWPQLTGLILPLGLGVGLLLTTYGASLRRQVAAARPRTADEHRRATLVRVLVTVLVAATLFWSVGDFAGVVGRDGWTISSGVLVVLPDTGQIRVEYTHG